MQSAPDFVSFTLEGSSIVVPSSKMKLWKYIITLHMKFTYFPTQKSEFIFFSECSDQFGFINIKNVY